MHFFRLSQRNERQFFYSSKDNKIIVSINITFLEKKYMNNYKPKSKVIIEEISRETLTPSAPSVDAPIIDEIQSYRRIKIDTPTPRIML